MSARPRPSAEALSATLARGQRLHATQVPDDVVAAAHDAPRDATPAASHRALAADSPGLVTRLIRLARG